MNETEIIEFSVPMWVDDLRYYETIQLKFTGKAIYLELSHKIAQTCVLGHLFLFFLTEVYWNSNNIFCLLRITKSSKQEQYICIAYDKSIWYTTGSLSWAVNAAYSTANQVLPEPSKGYKTTFH